MEPLNISNVLFRSMYISRKITVLTINRPVQDDINQKLQWFGNSIGLFNLRDKDKSCFRIFIALLDAGRHNAGLSSDDLAAKLHLSRGTIIHHINKLMESGIVIMDDGKYFIRVNSLEMLVEELEKDISRAIADLRRTAKEIDKSLKL